MTKKIGVLGGGQLGRMMGLIAPNYDLEMHFLDKDESFPSGQISPNFTRGDFNNYDDVIKFGEDKDVITIEIENVNVEALEYLESKGKKVFPQSKVIKTIKDKGLQKQFYLDHDIPSSGFKLYNNKEEIIDAINSKKLNYPFVQKSRTEGYDGKGVQVIKNEDNIDRLFNTPSVIEEMVDIEKEISVIVARDQYNNIETYPVVEMKFDPEANLLDVLICPARISKIHEEIANNLAIKTADAYGLIGILAVEMFIANDGSILVNESAPRAHNSGHHTIDNNYCSQFDQLIRTISGLHLGNAEMFIPAVMINLLGDSNSRGKVIYKGMEEVSQMKNVYIHIYGKEITKPYRKMGHITVLDQDLEIALEKAGIVKNTLKATSYE